MIHNAKLLAPHRYWPHVPADRCRGAWHGVRRERTGPARVRFILPNATGFGRGRHHARRAAGIVQGAQRRRWWWRTSPAQAGWSDLQTLARSAPDGNTLSMVSNNVVIFPSVLKSLPFDMPGDFTPIAVIGATPMVLVVNPAKLPATNSKEFDRAAQEPSRAPQLRLRRQRHHPAPGHRAVPRTQRRRHGQAHSLQGRGPDGHRHDRRPGGLRHRWRCPAVQAHIKSGALRAIGTSGAAAHARCAARSRPSPSKGLPNFAWTPGSP